MKNLLIATLLFCLSTRLSVRAQDIAGTKLLTVTYSSQGSNRYFFYEGIAPVEVNSGNLKSISIGISKVHNNNMAYGFGMDFIGYNSFVRTKPYTVGANVFVTAQKYKKIKGHLYYNPGAMAGAGYLYTEVYNVQHEGYFTAKSANAQFTVLPLALSYKLNNKLLINASVGSIVLDFNKNIYDGPGSLFKKNDESGINFNMSLTQAFSFGLTMIIK